MSLSAVGVGPFVTVASAVIGKVDKTKNKDDNVPSNQVGYLVFFFKFPHVILTTTLPLASVPILLIL